MASDDETPGARESAFGWSDSEGALWLFGGDGYDAEGSRGELNDLWRFDTDNEQWTWVHGPDAEGDQGSYGTQGVPHPDNRPGARANGLSVPGTSSGLWLFGGWGLIPSSSWDGDLNDLWRYDPATGEWTWESGTDERDEAGHYGTEGEPHPANMPGARSYRPAAWSTSSGEIWLFGGGGRDAQGDWGALNDLWKYDPGSNEWTWMTGASVNSQPGIYGVTGIPHEANTPGARFAPASWIDDAGEFWLFGGDGYDSVDDSGRLADLWRYDPEINQWTFVKGSSFRREPGSYGTRGVPHPENIPGGRDDAVSWTGDAGNLWLFGGNGRDEDGSRGRLNDLWRYSPSSNEWTWMSGGTTRNESGIYGTQGEADPGNTPGARTGAVAWTDNDGGLWLFGGNGYAAGDERGRLNDLWRYDITAEEWTWVSGSNTPDQPGHYGPAQPDAREIGDFNDDGCVDFQDFLFLINNWGEEIDGIAMGFNDLDALLENWGVGC